MADKVNMSLDDIIKMNKKSKPKTNKLRSTANTRDTRSKIKPRIPQQKQRQQPIKQQQDSGPTMLHVANLHFRVSDKDLKELFGEMGPIKKAAVHYDRSGRSIGTAEIIFHKRESAIRAIKEYNNRILDGRPMNITLVPSRTNTVSNNNQGMGIKKGSGIQKRSPQKSGSVGGRLRNQSQNRSPRKNGGPVGKGGRRPGKSTRQPKKELSASELDADLEAYKVTKMDTA